MINLESKHLLHVGDQTLMVFIRDDIAPEKIQLGEQIFYRLFAVVGSSEKPEDWVPFAGIVGALLRGATAAGHLVIGLADQKIEPKTCFILDLYILKAEERNAS